ncbi:hypothetical protein BGZ57DRAFT_995821 [Hyaloscypha finlandica]|nr:hypothetical protein BGZ57DRAFT_995821 [Hyaloscypha finlandica]
MAPSTGGRPPNAWNPSRRRKLVRLYTLTKLSKEEIQKVLAAPGFNPCPRDIQTQLHALLPSGYGKSHTKFHPSNDAKVKVRLDCLRRCKAGRISKERSARRQKCIVQTKLDQSRTISTALWESFDGGSQAFRNYATQKSKTFLPLPRDLSDAQPVTSSLLLLDGSEVLSHPSVSSFYPSIDASTNGLFKARRPTPQIGNNNNNRAIQEASSSTSIAHAELSTSSHDIGIIEEMLGAKHSGTCVKHVYRALRLSSGSSLRSNLTSLSSLASSLLSKLSSRNSRVTTAELTKEELKIWNELVDDSKMDIPRPLYTTISPLNRKCCMPPLLGMSFDTVSDLSGVHLSPLTDFYGNTLLHCAAAACKWNELWRVRVMIAKGANVNIRNTSGETFLHILCRHLPRTLEDAKDLVLILKLVQNIPVFSISDYHGRTILHYLFRGLDRHLFGDIDYPFFSFGLRKEVPKYSVRPMSEILEVIKPALWKQHFNTQDNAGNKVLDVLEDSCRRIGRKSFTKGMTKLMATVMKDITLPPSIVQYQSDLAGRATIPGQITNEDVYGWLGDLTLVPGMTEKEATERTLEDIRLERHLTWIDDLGDTPLTALLKSPLAATIPADSLRKCVKCMLKFGAEIHIRDRNGDTALAIAARLGIHSVVTLLLEEGANVHSRDYLGVGILSQTERSMHLAAGDEKLWAMIWSCRITLIDAGAKEKPTEQDEWMLPLSTRLKLQEGQDVNGQLV